MAEVDLSNPGHKVSVETTVDEIGGTDAHTWTYWPNLGSGGVAFRVSLDGPDVCVSKLPLIKRLARNAINWPFSVIER